MPEQAGLLIYGVRSRIAGVKAKKLSGRRSVSATALTLNPLLDSLDKFPNIKWRFFITTPVCILLMGIVAAT